MDPKAEPGPSCLTRWTKALQTPLPQTGRGTPRDVRRRGNPECLLPPFPSPPGPKEPPALRTSRKLSAGRSGGADFLPSKSWCTSSSGSSRWSSGSSRSRTAPQIGRLLGKLLRFFDRKHGRIAVKNLEKSRGVCPTDDIPEFVDRVYEHLGLGVVEMFMVPQLVRCGRIAQVTRLERFHVVKEVLHGAGA